MSFKNVKLFFRGHLDKAVSSDFASEGIQMVADSLDHRPSPEEAPVSPAAVLLIIGNVRKDDEGFPKIEGVAEISSTGAGSLSNHCLFPPN